MKKLDKGLLLVVNGDPANQASAAYGVWLAERLLLPVTVLGIIEKVSRRQPIEQIIATVRTGLERSDLSCDVRIINGKIPEAIIQNASPGRHLALFGPCGRP